MKIINDLKKICTQVENNVLLKDYTTYRLAGRAKVVVYPSNIKELKKILAYIKQYNLKYKIIGNGSNLIFATDYYDGILIKLDKFDNLIVNNNLITVGAGYKLIKLAYFLSEKGFSGLEFATGIPGTVGGAVYMNAGAYNESIGNIIVEVKGLTSDLKIKTLSKEELNFAYRYSILQISDFICLEATLKLKEGQMNVIKELISNRKERRVATQPLEYPNAGSVFRNPQDIPAWKLIEATGYKGKVFNGILISDKHANFIINPNGGSGKDIKLLIEKIKQDVKDKFEIELIVEQEIIE